MIQEGVLLPIPIHLAPAPADEVNWQNQLNSNAIILMDLHPGLLCERGQSQLQGLALVHEKGACVQQKKI